MNSAIGMYLRFAEAHRRQVGQSMPECVLIISVVAIAAYVIYQGLALGVGKVIADIASSLEAV